MSMWEPSCGCKPCLRGDGFMCRLIAPLEQVLNDHLGHVSSTNANRRRLGIIADMRKAILTHPTYVAWKAGDSDAR